MKDLFIEFYLYERLSEDSLLEISARQIENKYFYLEKGKFNQDFNIINNNLFLYTDIEKGDEGYIMVDFFKLKGEIYGKIIENITEKKGIEFKEQ